METCDVLIVGGGPAGSSCASVLQQAGLDVLILDKAAFPRDKPCAGWVTPQVFQSLKIDITEYATRFVCQPITGFRCGVIGQQEVCVSYDEVVSYGVRRCEFDSYLLARSGARCKTGERVAALEQRDDCWVVNGMFAAPVIVGAGGHFCPVARALKARNKHEDTTVFAREAEFCLTTQDGFTFGVQPEIPELYFCPDLAGYGWCFRKGDYANIGLGRKDATDLAKQINTFTQFLYERGKMEGDIPCRLQGHAYLLHVAPAKKIFDDRALLIGDAAGFAYRQSGEGIRPAVESGLIAADVIIKADGRYHAHNLKGYQVQVEQRFGSSRAQGGADWFPSSWLHVAAARLLAQPWFTRRVVIDRWFLHAKQAPLAI